MADVYQMAKAAQYKHRMCGLLVGFETAPVIVIVPNALFATCYACGGQDYWSDPSAPHEPSAEWLEAEAIERLIDERR